MSLKNFEQLYENLNAAQKKAVDHIDGPMMVIAGPGTGKTQILSTRILNILRKTDVGPQNILCLTYTDAGSFAMQQRLASFMGAEAYKVNVHTFHGLCNRIIRENSEKFGYKNLRLMDEMDKFDLLNTIIDGFDEDAPIKSFEENPEYIRKNLADVFDLMQKEDVTAENVKRKIIDVLDPEMFKILFPELVYKKKTKTSEAGDIKKAEYDKLSTDWQKLEFACIAYQEYIRLKKKAGLFDYNDMLIWVNDLLERDAELLMYYQEQFQYILVDEYQDTSGIQNKILFHLISYWDDNPNCFVVGDDDQSIYKFQGARLDNMLDFKNKFESNLSTVLLEQNYRSTQPILDASASLISNNQKRLVNSFDGMTKQLIASGVNKELTDLLPQKLEFKNPLYEAVGISEIILQLHEKDKVEFQEMAVIYSKHRLAEELIDTFNEFNIPYNLVKNIDILQTPIIIQACDWLQFFADELKNPGYGEHLLFQLMHAKEHKISPAAILNFNTQIKSFRAENTFMSWSEFADRNRNELEPALNDFFTKINEILESVHTLSLPEMVMFVLNKMGLVAQALNEADSEFQLELLHTFISFIKNKIIENPELRLADLVELFSKMVNARFGISLERRLGNKNGVNFTTAHGSKGLEYDVVFVIQSTDVNWERDSGNTLPFGLLKLLNANINEIPENSKDEEGLEERRRLYYVAVTRAKKYLYLSTIQEGFNTKKHAASRFLTEFSDAEFISPNFEANQITALNTAFLLKTKKPKINPIDSDWLKHRMDQFVFSPSSVSDLFDCGLRFYYNRLLRVPSAGNDNMAYGNLLHELLRFYLKAGVAKNANWLTTSEAVQWFETEMQRQRGEFSGIAFAKRLEQGRFYIPQYLNERKPLFEAQLNIELEKKINTKIADIDVTARLDKLVYDGSYLEIVDYKTGKPKNVESKIKVPSKQSIDGHKFPNKYWFQMGMYILICRQHFGTLYNVNTAYIDCMDVSEQGDFPLFKTVYSSTDLEYIQSWVVEAKNKLNNFDFLEGCGKPTCEWCEFVKNTGQTIVPDLELEN